MDAGTVQDISVLPDVWGLALKSAGMLLIVMAVLVGFVFLLRRMTAMRQLTGQGAVTVRGTYHLGPKERLVLVDVEGVRLLLGVTPSGIRTLHTFGKVEESLEAEGKTPSFFETLFRRQLGKGDAQDKESEHGS